MLLFRPDLEDDQLQSAVERVTRAIVNAGGSLSKISPWGKRRLAYPIQHHRDASYFLIHFDIEPAAVREIERGLLISEEILRHLVVVLEPRHRRAGDGEDEAPTYAADGEDEGREGQAAAGANGTADREDKEDAVAERETDDGDQADETEDESEPAGVTEPEEVAG
jgi:small subunit ribosomal protein S6